MHFLWEQAYADEYRSKKLLDIPNWIFIYVGSQYCKGIQDIVDE